MDSLLTALVLDDEPKACRLLNSLLDEFCDEIGEVFVTTSWKEAINKLETEQPDILFLDIKMPSLNGFDFLNTAENHISKVIFTTAYSEYAIKAIKHGAFDYLLKPIQVDELKIAVQKAARDQKELNKNNLSSVLNLLQEKIVPRQSTLAIHDKGGLIFIKIDTIILLEGQGNYTKIHCQDRTYISSKTSKSFESLLDPNTFIRVHKSYIVNINHVKKFNSDGNGELEMSNKFLVPVSKRKRRILNNFSV